MWSVHLRLGEGQQPMQHVQAAPLLGGPRACRYGGGLMLDGKWEPPLLIRTQGGLEYRERDRNRGRKGRKGRTVDRWTPVVMKDGGSLRRRLRTDGARKNRRECLPFLTAEPRSPCWGKTGRSDACFLSRRSTTSAATSLCVVYRPIVSVIVFCVSAPHWFLLRPPSHQNPSTSFDVTTEYASMTGPLKTPDGLNASINLNFCLLSFLCHVSRCLYLRHYVHGYGCITTPIFHRMRLMRLIFPQISFRFQKNPFCCQRG